MAPALRHSSEDFVIISHENRLQSTEASINAANVSLERVETNLTNALKTMEEGFRVLGSKMDHASTQNESIESKVVGLIPRIEELEKANKVRLDRTLFFRTSVIGLVSVGAGAAFSKWGESFAVFVSNLWR